MTINLKLRQLYADIIENIICIIYLIFLFILIRPLYKFSKERNALFILLSKSCSNIIYQFIWIYANISRYLPLSNFYLIKYFVQPGVIICLNSDYFHILGLALNRFHAVFLPFSYQNVWEMK
ncbi:hypothetical protein Mgra_00008105 [Meloidogyne graminicola]|uniref:Serpentine receptor class gamma n=1 Tax=Meloidogyne graminicola TaxID=189291 RepID=A0A8S9ZGT8_9BILA|nr:hypothetical protein Mgra_00008105 [Meloidogyne graminicola]